MILNGDFISPNVVINGRPHAELLDLYDPD